MTFRFSTLPLITTTVALLSLGINSQKANAQNFPLETTYSSEVTLTELGNNFFQADVQGSSPDAPYGLTDFEIRNSYAKLNPDIGEFVFDPDPTKLDNRGVNVEGLPKGTLTLSGDGSDKLFGELIGSTTIDFEEGVGSGSSILKIVGGEGRFNGATGILNVSENDIVNPDGSINPRYTTSGSFQVAKTIPEPRNTKTILGMGIIGAGLLLHQRQKTFSRNLSEHNL
ncbi:MAG: hypothetical protein AAFW70_09555 [Cyanobacteria bacterium J06635_10]